MANMLVINQQREIERLLEENMELKACKTQLADQKDCAYLDEAKDQDLLICIESWDTETQLLQVKISDLENELINVQKQKQALIQDKKLLKKNIDDIVEKAKKHEQSQSFSSKKKRGKKSIVGNLEDIVKDVYTLGENILDGF